jgi:hypothetical protein
MPQEANPSGDHILKLILSLESVYTLEREWKSNSDISDSDFLEEQTMQRDIQIQELTKLLQETKLQLEKERKRTRDLQDTKVLAFLVLCKKEDD